uniref:Large ribosomal subunit protein uL15m n=2 Tax=Macrostomum lignano TaxID=282301 RepID=A0A1I8H6J8_9PLAT
MSVRSKLGLIRRMPRIDLYGPRATERFDPQGERHWTKRYQFGGSEEWGERWGERQSFLPIGNHVRKMPFYLAIPSEPYNADWLHRRELVRISLLDLQRLVDLGRINPSKPVDLTDIAATRLFPLKDRQYGYQLTDDAGLDNLTARFARLEVQHASEAAIAAIERSGGRIVCRFYDLSSIAAKSDPRAFFATGQPLPACKLPPVSAIDYYSSAESRGYLANPADIDRCRDELAQKYGYSLSTDSIKHEDQQWEKSPRQIFAGLQPGSVVSVADRLVYKPLSADVLAHYQRPCGLRQMASDEVRTFCSLPSASQKALLAYPDLVNRCLNRYASTGSARDSLLSLLDSCPELLTAVDNRTYRESMELLKLCCVIEIRLATHCSFAIDLDTEAEGGPLIERLLDEWPEQVHTCYDTEGRNVLHHCAADGRCNSLRVILRCLLTKFGSAAQCPSLALTAAASAFSVPDSVESLTPIHYMAKSCRLDLLQVVAEFASTAQLVINFDQPWPTGHTPLCLAAVAEFASPTQKLGVCRWLVESVSANPRTALSSVAGNSAAKSLLNQLVAEFPDSAFCDSEDDNDEEPDNEADESEEEAKAEDQSKLQVDAAISQVERLGFVDKKNSEQNFQLSNLARRQLADGLRSSGSVDDSSRFIDALLAGCPTLSGTRGFLQQSAEPVLLCLSLLAADSSCSRSGETGHPGSLRLAIQTALRHIGRTDLMHILTDNSDNLTSDL